jgi:hypothetical protein
LPFSLPPPPCTPETTPTPTSNTHTCTLSPLPPLFFVPTDSRGTRSSSSSTADTCVLLETLWHCLCRSCLHHPIPMHHHQHPLQHCCSTALAGLWCGGVRLHSFISSTHQARACMPGNTMNCLTRLFTCYNDLYSLVHPLESATCWCYIAQSLLAGHRLPCHTSRGFAPALLSSDVLCCWLLHWLLQQSHAPLLWLP